MPSDLTRPTRVPHEATCDQVTMRGPCDCDASEKYIADLENYADALRVRVEAGEADTRRAAALSAWAAHLELCQSCADGPDCDAGQALRRAATGAAHAT